MMKARLFAVLALFVCVCLVSPSQGFGEAKADLAAAEATASDAALEAAATQRAVESAERSYRPIAARADAAGEAVAAAEEKIESLEQDLIAERRAAAEEIEAAESDYDSEKSSNDTTTAIGFGAAVVALVVAFVAFCFSRFRKWPLSKPVTQVCGAALGLVFVGGLLLALVPSAPQQPEISEETAELARAAAGDPADPPTGELEDAEAALIPLKDDAEPLEAASARAKDRYSTAAARNRDAQRALAGANRNVRIAERKVERIEFVEHEEENFKAEATAIDYNQLLKNPEAYRGEKVVYTGQILQIQEEGGLGFMLLSVTDEGFGFWTDNIWVNFFEPIGAAEEDVITVYGKLTGSEEYETQIGGSTYVPRMTAKYVEE